MLCTVWICNTKEICSCFLLILCVLVCFFKLSISLFCLFVSVVSYLCAPLGVTECLLETTRRNECMKHFPTRTGGRRAPCLMTSRETPTTCKMHARREILVGSILGRFLLAFNFFQFVDNNESNPAAWKMWAYLRFVLRLLSRSLPPLPDLNRYFIRCKGRASWSILTSYFWSWRCSHCGCASTCCLSSRVVKFSFLSFPPPPPSPELI